MYYHNCAIYHFAPVHDGRVAPLVHFDLWMATVKGEDIDYPISVKVTSSYLG